MALRTVVIAVLTASTAVIPHICHGPTVETLSSQARLPIAPVPTRQKNDAVQHPQRHLPEIDQDIPYETVAFGLPEIHELQHSGVVTLELPDGAPITLTMECMTHTAGITSMTLTSNGLRSTLSHRGEHFYLTLATPHGGYRIEGSGTQSRLIYNQTLNQRMITTDVDYRHAH